MSVQNDLQAVDCAACGSPLLINGYRAVRQLNAQDVLPVLEAESAEKKRIVIRLIRDSQLIKYVQDIVMGLRLTAQLSKHPVCPQIIDAFSWRFHDSEDPIYCVLLEKIEGSTLKEYIECHSVSDEQVISWMVQLFEMLKTFHRQSWILRDIKPENLVLSPEGRLIFVDIASLFHLSWEQDASFLHLTTPGYSAPEQNDGRPLPDSDVFALGRTAIFCLTERSPVELYTQTGFEWRQGLKHRSPLLLEFVERLVSLNPIGRPRTGDAIDYLKLLPAKIRRETRWNKYKWPVTIALGMVLLGVAIPLEKRFASWSARIRADREQLVGNTEQAHALYERSLRANSNNASAYVGLGMTCIEERCGIEHLEKALVLQPDDYLALYNLAVLYEEENRQRALELYGAISSESDRYLPAQNNVARLEVQQGNYEQAIVILDTILMAEDSDNMEPELLAQMYKNKGWAYLQADNEEQAIEHLTQSISLNPIPGDAYCLLASINQNLADLVSCFSLDLQSSEARVLKTQLFSEYLRNNNL